MDHLGTKLRPIRRSYPVFESNRLFFCDDLGWVGFSLGVHFSAWRVDVHLARWIFSFGRVPVYVGKTGTRYAVSNSYHRAVTTKGTDATEYPRPRI